MAKIRVHELAKKLNMTNKALLTKLKAMNIEVKSHMSSLEDETVDQIKLNIFGNKQKEQVSKIGTSVIRRRRPNRADSHQTNSEPRKEETNSLERERTKEKQFHEKPVTEPVNPSTGKTLSQSDPTPIPSQKAAGEEAEAEISGSEISERSDENSEMSAPDSRGDRRPPATETVKNYENRINPEKETSPYRSSVHEVKLVTPQKAETVDLENQDRKELSVAMSNADNIKKTPGDESSDTFATLQETDRSGATDKNQKTEIFNTEEADMPIDSENQNKSKEPIPHQEKSDEMAAKNDQPISAIQHQDSDINTADDASDLSQGKDSSLINDRKKKRKKKQKKSEPARIIKLAEPVQIVPPVTPPPQKKEPSEKAVIIKSTQQDKERTPSKDHFSSQNERGSSDTSSGFHRDAASKDKASHDRDKSQHDRERDSGRSHAKEHSFSEKNQSTTSYPSNRAGGTNRTGGKNEPLVKVKGKKDVDLDVQFIPVEPPPDKDDAKSKRNKNKNKKKKWIDEEDPSDDSKSGQKKRKSVVEGKDLYEQGFSGKKGRKKDGKGGKQRPKIQKTLITVPKAIKRRIRIDETIDLSELAKRMSIKANEMIQKLMGMGIMVTVNQTIDFDTAALVAAEFDYEVEKNAAAEDILLQAHEADDPDKLVPRSPVVTIMGHVDHGKTSLLDVIRKSKITTGEAGGITQHIGAYSVETPNGGIVTFLDTPGHAAFTSMRSRGAQITDLVVLVVAADDGVMPQTIEAINHSKAAGVPVVVAVNKMDKPEADPDRVMRELSDHGLLSEDWGGDVIFARVSAKSGTGIDELLEMILLQAEVLELKANPDRLAMGHVVEARLDAGRGPVATVLVQQGTLKTGQPVVCGLHSGKIRLMSDDMGRTIESAGPSTPVEIVGLSGVPEAGDEFVALASEKDAKQISESRMQKERAKELAKKSRANLEKLFANMGSDQAKQLKLIIKADVHGSLEALNESLIKLSQEEVDIKIVHSGTGAINESDVSLAAVSDAIIIGFNVRPTTKVREMAKEENVDMRFYDIIYNVINDIKTALTGLMPSTFNEIIIGRAEVRDIFVIPGRGTIAGCFVQEGKVARGEKVRLLREGVVKCDSIVSSLRRFKDDAKEVSQGYECGIGIEKFNDIKMGDIIECYQIEEIKASLESIKE